MWQTAIIAALLCGAVEVEVQTLVGPRAAGTLEALTAEEAVVVVNGESRRIERAALLAIVPQTAPPESAAAATVWIELTDGSELAAAAFTVAGRTAAVTLLSPAEPATAADDSLAVPTRAITAVRFRRQDERLAQQWREIIAAEHRGDVVVVRRPEGQTLDFLEGVLFDVTPQSVAFEFDGDRLNISRDRVEGLVYHHPLGGPKGEPLAALFDARGNRWNLKSLALAEDRLELTTVAGVAASAPLSTLKKIDFSLGKIAYLSDLEPLLVEWSAYFDGGRLSASLAQMYQPRRDRSFSGGRLKLRNDGREQEFDKGLAVHSRTLLVYRLGGAYRRFSALAGIDPEVRQGGHVRLAVYGDGKVLFDEGIRGGDPPTPLQLDVEGVDRLRILVDFGEGLDIADYLNLCDAKVTK